MFYTAIPADEPGGQGEGHLVGIAYPIRAAEAILTKQPEKRDIVSAGIKQRDSVLIAVGDIQIEQPGFQGLKTSGPTKLKVALHKETAIEAKDGYGPAYLLGTCSLGGAGVVEKVLGMAQAEFR